MAFVLLALILAADPASLTPEQVVVRATVEECFKLIDSADEQTILAIRQHTFNVLKARKEKAAEPTQEDSAENPAA